MTNIESLFRVELQGSFDSRKFKTKKRAISFGGFIAIVIIGLFILSSLYNVYLAELFYRNNADLGYSTIIMASAASFITFTTSIFKIKAIFSSGDYDLLQSLPIKKRDIILAKILNLYVTELIYSGLFLLPNTIINVCYDGQWLRIFSGIAIIILTPALPMVFAFIISTFITIVTDRYKYGNIFTFFIYVALFAAILYFTYTTSNFSSAEYFAANMINMAERIVWINPTLYLVRLSYFDNPLFILAFIFTNLIALLLVSSFIGFLYNGIHNLVTNYSKPKKNKFKELKCKSQFNTLLEFEFRRFFNSKVYFMNCISSGIFAMMMSFAIAFSFSKYSGFNISEEIVDLVREYAFVGSLIITFGIGTSTPAAVGINIEGRNFWIIKSTPIIYKKMLLAKIICSSVILGICSMIASTFIVILIEPTVFSSIMLYIIPILYVIFVSIVGLLININYPKISWKNENECVKQSGSILITMITDWAITIGFGLILVFGSMWNHIFTGLIVVILLIILIVISYMTMIKQSVKKINNIS